jgi:hypothetical protein
VTGIAAGTATITATTKSAGRIARAAITVTAPESSDGDEPDPYPGAGTTNAIAATGIVLSATTAKVMVGATATLLAALVPPGAHSSPVIWVSANPKVATVGDDGVVRGIRAGKTTVTATSGHLSASAAITVTKAKTRVQAKVPTSSKAGARVSVKVKVAAGGGGKLGGKLRVTLVKGRITLSKTVPVKAKSNAKYVTVPLPKVTQPGKYKLTIVYLGTTSHAKTTIVKRITIK